MSIVALIFAVVFVFCMSFLAGAVGSLIAEFGIGALSKSKPLPAAAAISIRLIGWLAGSIVGGVVAWQRFWDGMWSDGSKTYMPNVPDQPYWGAAVIVGLVLFWIASWMARTRRAKSPAE
jgi:hypothetical protein